MELLAIILAVTISVPLVVAQYDCPQDNNPHAGIVLLHNIIRYRCASSPYKTVMLLSSYEYVEQSVSL